MSDICRCGNLKIFEAGYCNSCSASLMRQWRKNHGGSYKSLTEFSKNHAKTRARFHQALKRGQNGMRRGTACEIEGCTGTVIEAHHPDYSQAFSVHWFCRDHHLDHHRKQKRVQCEQDAVTLSEIAAKILSKSQRSMEHAV